MVVEFFNQPAGWNVEIHPCMQCASDLHAKKARKNVVWSYDDLQSHREQVQLPYYAVEMHFLHSLYSITRKVRK